VYAAIGELPAVIAAACLTLEYVVSGSAVARSWGDKMVDWLKNEIDLSGWMLYLLDPGFGFNPLAFLISLVSTLSLLQGVKESKSVTNFFTSVKVILVMYMIVGGAFYFQSKNLTPFIPKSMGMSGMMRGATSSFFGYIGYDEVCCVAGEAINPQKNMPRAVMLTIGIVTLLTVLASFSLVGMQPYFDISATSGFPEAFRYNDAIIASQICAVRNPRNNLCVFFAAFLKFSFIFSTKFGEIFTLPIVVLITLMAQPRLGFALAKDGLLPEIFGEVNESGNIFKGTLIFGALMTFIAAFMPFAYLDDLISGGILIAFSMTNSSLVILRHESPDDKPFLLQKHLFLFNFFSLLTGLSMKNLGFNIFGQMITFALAIITLWISLRLARKCPQSVIFGGKSASQNSVPFERENGAFYKVPFVPYLPCMGIFINWYLVAQLQLSGFVLLILYISGACIFYYKYGIKHSRGNAHQWKIYNTLGEVEQDNEHMFGTYARTISLPRRKSQTHLT